MSIDLSDINTNTDVLPSLSLTPTSSGSDTFTMVFMDFDDTLIPSRIYRLFAHDMNIDITEYLSKSLIKRLQETIIATLKMIKKENSTENDHIVFSIVSNATTKWLDYLLKGDKDKKITSRLPILNAYLEENEVTVVSASAKAYEFLVDKFGDKADAIFNHTLNSDGKGNKWMWKYTSFSAIVRDYKRKTNSKCRRIISIGDGSDEEKASRHYAKTHNVESLHIRLLRGPTITQLQQQWQYIQWKLYGTIINDIDDEVESKLCDNKTYKDCDDNDIDFHAFDLRKLFDTDNSNGLTGKMHQIPAIEKYFQLWMKQLSVGHTAEDKSMAINRVCQAIHKRMYGLDAASNTSKNFKLILVKAICKNKEFNSIFNRYYKSVQRRSDELARIKKHIRKTQRKRSKNKRARPRASSNAAAYDGTNTSSSLSTEAPQSNPSMSTSKSNPTISTSTLSVSRSPRKRLSIC